MAYAGWFLLAIALCGAGYTAAAAIFARRFLHRDVRVPPEPASAVTILKPLHGADTGLEEALATAVQQDYPAQVQMVCGLARPSDPAVEVVERLRRRFPDREITLVVDDRTYGANRKVSNLVNMIVAAKHGVVVLADADIEAPRDWLSAVVGALQGSGVGAVSCFYSGEGRGLWGRLVAMGISYQFLPNGVFGVVAGLAHPCMGSTVALRREMLAEIGGFEAFRDTLADDYEIGRAVRAKGSLLAYPAVVVRHVCTETSFRELWRHELRWARTIRTLNPIGHFGSAVTYPLPLALVGAVLTEFSLSALIVLTTVLLARLFLKTRIDHIAWISAGPSWLLPVRDVLSFAVFLASLIGHGVDWQGERLKIGAHGAIS